MPKNSSAARREEIRRLAAAENITYTAALRRLTTGPDHYFVALVTHGLGRFGNGATVRDARTGVVTALVPTPEEMIFDSVTAAAQPGMFFLTGYFANGRDGQAAHLYRLRVDEAGTVAELAPLPGLLEGMSNRIAVTPDGTRLAVPRMPEDGSATELHIITLATGEHRTLATQVAGSLEHLSFAADGKTLAFEWSAPRGLDRIRVRVVDLETAEDLFADGREVAEISEDLGLWTSPLIGDGGQYVYVTVAQPEPAGGPHWNRLLEIPIAAGPSRTLLETRFENNSHNGIFTWTTVCRDATGPRLLAFSDGYVHRIDIPTGENTRLPFPEGGAFTAAW